MGNEKHNGKFGTCRPKTLDDMIGQRHAVEKLRRMIQACEISGENPSHIFMTGASGTGKTTASLAVANALSMTLVQFDSTSRPCDLRVCFRDLLPNSILFIDEAHALVKDCETILLTATERGIVMMPVRGEDPDKIELPPFTLILATTNPEQMCKPLRNRFDLHCEFMLYDLAEMKQIVTRASQLYSVRLSAPAVAVLAQASRGVARRAEQVVRRVRDSAAIEGTNGKQLSKAFVLETLRIDGADLMGLSPIERKLLEVYAGAYPDSMQLQAAASALDLDPNTVRREHEPYLRRLGLIENVAGGRRSITEVGLRHLGRAGS